MSRPPTTPTPAPGLWTNDPAEQRALVLAATSGSDLIRYRRAGDLRRDQLLGRHAPLAALDETFFDYVATEPRTLATALLGNPNLPRVPLPTLTAFALEVLDCWEEPMTAAGGYVLALCDVAPGLDREIAAAIEGAFRDKRWQRNNRSGARATEAYFALVDEVDPALRDWLVRSTGNQSPGVCAAVFHPEAIPEVGVAALEGGGQDAVLHSPLRGDPSVRDAIYDRNRNNPGALAVLFTDETDPARLRATVQKLWGNAMLLYLALNNRQAAGRTLPVDLKAELLEHPERQVRETVILMPHEQDAVEQGPARPESPTPRRIP
jgi:hypothetical protein